MRLEEKIISGGDYFNDRQTFVSLEASDSTDEKRYKWSDRSELVGFLEKTLTSQTNLGSSQIYFMQKKAPRLRCFS